MISHVYTQHESDLKRENKDNLFKLFLDSSKNIKRKREKGKRILKKPPSFTMKEKTVVNEEK